MAQNLLASMARYVKLLTKEEVAGSIPTKGFFQKLILYNQLLNDRARSSKFIFFGTCKPREGDHFCLELPFCHKNLIPELPFKTNYFGKNELTSPLRLRQSVNYGARRSGSQSVAHLLTL